MVGWIEHQGLHGEPSGITDLASKVSVSRESFGASEESEPYISASVEAMVVVRCVAKRKGLWEGKPWFLY